MIEIMFWVLYILAPIVIWGSLKILGIEINSIQVIPVVVWFIYIFSVVGALPLFYMVDDYRVATGVNDQYVMLKVLAASVVCIASLLTGAISAKKILCSYGANHKKLYASNFYIRKFSKKENYLMVMVALASIAVLLKYISKIDDIAIFTVIADGVQEAKLARSEMGNNFDGKYHWYSLFMHTIGLWAFLSFYINWLLERNLKNKLFFIISGVAMLFSVIMATEKAPLLDLIISMFLAYYLTMSKGVIPLRRLFVFFAILLTFGVILYLGFMGVTTVSGAIFSVFSRAFAGSLSPAYFYLEYFPAIKDFLYGESFPNPGGLLPFTPFRHTVELMLWVHPELKNLGIVGSMPTVFWAEAYANFGVIGIFTVPFLIGVLLFLIQQAFNFKYKNPMNLALLVWVIVHYKKLSITGFTGFIFDFHLIGILSIFGMFVLIARVKFRFS